MRQQLDIHSKRKVYVSRIQRGTNEEETPCIATNFRGNQRRFDLVHRWGAVVPGIGLCALHAQASSEFCIDATTNVHIDCASVANGYRPQRAVVSMQKPVLGSCMGQSRARTVCSPCHCTTKAAQHAVHEHMEIK
jgi:hypothetical protein